MVEGRWRSMAVACKMIHKDTDEEQREMARSLLLAFVVVATTHAFSATTHASTARPKTRVAPLSMGLFDAFAAAFKNEDFTRDDVRCRARHVLVPDEARAAAVLAELEGGADFAAVARRESTCASASKGGDLGEFKRGAMVPEFDEVRGQLTRECLCQPAVRSVPPAS